METLKKLEELCEPDIRQSFFLKVDIATGQTRPTQQRDLYDRVAAIELHTGVPEEIRSHFATALNLLVYSWYCYQFNVTAQFMAYVSVEYALKVRYPSDKRQQFSSLVRRSVDDGLVKDSGFSQARANIPGIGEVHLIPPMFLSAEKPYVESLAEVMPSLRNTLAHGATSIHNHGPQCVLICAEFINQLFSDPDNAS